MQDKEDYNSSHRIDLQLNMINRAFNIQNKIWEQRYG